MMLRFSAAADVANPIANGSFVAPIPNKPFMANDKLDGNKAKETR